MKEWFPLNGLTHTDFNKLLLLPDNFNIRGHERTLQQVLDTNKIVKRLIDLEIAIQPILKNLEEKGLLISEDWFNEGVKDKKMRLVEATKELNKIIGLKSEFYNDVPIREYWQLKQLPVAYSLEHLNNYKNLDRSFKLVLEIKNIQSYLTQWEIKLLKEGVHREQGIQIYGSWTSYSSFTGRVSAKKLALTSLPKKLRNYIRAPEGYRIISLDLNAAELRFMAYFSECETMLDVLNSGQDLHTEIAKIIQRIIFPNTKVNEKLYRDLAKTYIFSFLYGAGNRTIANNLRAISSDITTADVKNLEQAFDHRYPKINQFLQYLESSEYLYTPLGKLKPTAEFKRNQKRNFLFQASVAYAVKHLLLIASRYYEVIHIQHDEIWLLAPSRAPTAATIEEITYLFNNKLQELFTEFPVNNLLTLNSIGGLQ